MPSKFGGVPVEESKSKFGGVLVEEQPTVQKQGSVPTEPPSAWEELGKGNIRKALAADWQQGLIGTGLRQAGGGVRGLVSGADTPTRLRGASDVIRGTSRALMPAAIPLALANPLTAATGLVSGLAGQKGGELAAEKLGASPEAQALSGDVTGLVTGGLGARTGQGFSRGAARGLVKSALSLPGKAEAYGATPAEAVLEETSGVRPSTVARTARQRIGALTGEMENRVGAARTPVDLAPARDVLSNAAGLATRQGNKLVHTQLEPMQEALAGNRVTGQFYPSQVSPAEALDIKRGFGDEFTTFNPTIHETTNTAAKNVYGLLRRGIEQSAPGVQDLNQRISSLIPASRRAQLTDFNAGLGERVLGRVSRPTGGLAPALMGYHEGGPLGAALGLVGAEAAGSPVPKMIGARWLFPGNRTLFRRAQVPAFGALTPALSSQGQE